VTNLTVDALQQGTYLTSTFNVLIELTNNSSEPIVIDQFYPRIYQSSNLGGTNISSEFSTTEMSVTLEANETRTYTFPTKHSTPITEGPARVDAYVGYSVDTTGEASLTRYLSQGGWVGASPVNPQIALQGSPHTLTFDTAGGSVVSEMTYNLGDVVESPTSPTKNGYTFEGWEPSVPSIMPAEDLAVTATWTPNTYVLSFNTNGGNTIASRNQTFQAAVNFPDTPTKSGYTFSGWNSASDGEGTLYESDETYQVAGDTTLYAQWTTNTYILAFNTDGGTSVAALQYAFQAELAAPIEPTKNGYTFSGWEPVIPQSMPADDVTVNAQWTINTYTLSFNSNGASSVPDSVQVVYSNSLGTLPIVSRMGYFFEAWLTESSAQVPSTMPASDMTLIASWTAKNYENITTPTDLDPGEAVTTNETVANGDFTIPALAKLATTTFSGSGSITNYGTLETEAMSFAGNFLNDGILTTKHAIVISSGGRFTASANSHITIHHTPASQVSSLSAKLQSGLSSFIAEGILTIVLDDDVLDLPTYTFPILDAVQIEGAFDTINLPSLPSGYFWDSSVLYSNGTLSIIGTAKGLVGRPLNYPNPFKWSQGTYIGYTLKGAQDTELRVYTLRGQEIYKKTFVSNAEQGALAGYNKIQISTMTTSEPWSAGVYPYLILQNGDVIGRGRMVVIP
jgi:uncharacterized repeat protein (TIGR02543 family)